MTQCGLRRGPRKGRLRGTARAVRGVTSLACIEEPDVAKRILACLGLRAQALSALSALRAQTESVTLELFAVASRPLGSRSSMRCCP